MSSIIRAKASLGLALCAALALGGAAAMTAAMPAQAHAKATKVYVSGKSYDAKKNFRHGAKVTWNAKLQRLTINGTTVKGVSIKGTGTATVRVLGKSAVSKGYGLKAAGSLKLTGSGSLSLSGANCGISAASVYFAGPKVTLTGSSKTGAVSGRNVTVSAGSLTVAKPGSIAVKALGSKTTPGTFKVTGGKVVASSTSNGGINANNVKVTGGTVSVTGAGSVVARSYDYNGKAQGGSLYVTGGKLSVQKSLYGTTGKVDCSRISVGGSVKAYGGDKVAVVFVHQMKKVAASFDCTSDGRAEHYACTGCGLLSRDAGGKDVVENKDDLLVKALGHDLVKVEAAEPKCEQSGVIAHLNCKVCGTKYDADADLDDAKWGWIPALNVQDITVAALGHDMSEPYFDRPNLQTKCSRCPAVNVITPNATPAQVLESLSWQQIKELSAHLPYYYGDHVIQQAAKYGLVRDDGKLRGDEVKTLTLRVKNGEGRYYTKTVHVQILGFCHDVDENGKKIGITFGFKEIVNFRNPNNDSSNAGGWKGSELRAWLNSQIYSSIPADLRDLITPASKSTNNRGGMGVGTGDVTSTTDKLWLLSNVECYGRLDGNDEEDPATDGTGTEESNASGAAVFNLEGGQYKLYADNGVTSYSNEAFLRKIPATGGYWSWWWTRSATPWANDLFRVVDEWGRPNVGEGYIGHGISPAFCL
ncbi:MAG: DUF6273 domain-containing protein [Coriobacteriia bacterium]|nr:DUF6273 domain-containing protein [Coriobacteriia bacterium]